jgi:Phosphatidylinositol 3- and 4-kinase
MSSDPNAKFCHSFATADTQDTVDKTLPSSIPLRSAKIGSLQIFADNLGPIENFSSDIFEADEIHKIAILDIRLLNLDRNLCNILVCCDKGQESNFEKYRLVPIDHGLSIPDTLSINSYELAWLSF